MKDIAFLFAIATLLTFFALPTAALADSFCPEGGERFSGSEQFCPSHGVKLKRVDGQGTTTKQTDAEAYTAPAVEAIEVAKVAKVQGGYTVEDIYRMRGELSNRTVKVRGTVVKYSAEIMQRNWLHIQDGTGSETTNDLTVTTTQTAVVGDLVVVEGLITIDKDFDYGYKYDVIMENADVTIETEN